MCANDANRKVATAFLRQSKGAAETKTYMRQLTTRFRGTEYEPKTLRVDRGSENVDARKTVQDELDIDVDMGVGHGATVESKVNVSSNEVRKARIFAGLPTILWPMILIGMLFHGMRYALKTAPGLEQVRGDWQPMPIGARVLYLPKADRMKTERFEGYTRIRIHMGYAHDLSCEKLAPIASLLPSQKGMSRRGRRCGRSTPIPATAMHRKLVLAPAGRR